MNAQVIYLLGMVLAVIYLDASCPKIDLLLYLRFDNPDNRSERQKDDKLAAIFFIFNKFVNNSQQL